MSAKFIWVRNPTAINGKATTYVSLRGSDTNGDGTAQNPYRSLAKATTVAAANTNIMIDDGNWNEARTANNRNFNWFGNGKTILKNLFQYYKCKYYYFIIESLNYNYDSFCYYEKCIIIDKKSFSNSSGFCCKNCIIINSIGNNGYFNQQDAIFENCVLLDIKNICFCYSHPSDTFGMRDSKNNIIKYSGSINFYNSNICNSNFTNSAIPSTAVNSINDANTGQTIADYFNYVHPNVLANPNTATIDDWLACDLTAKNGSANIGAGTNGGNIGFNQGYPARATNDSNDIFAAANGATLRNVAWNATLNGYSLVHKDKVCAGYTVNTITLAADAEATDDYYNGLFIGITAGDGAGEIHRIIDYNGATRVATIDTSWQSAISTSSIYSISGTIDSATKDFGRIIKVKRNWAFLANMQSWTDPNVSSYGMWKEFLTSPLQNNGEWMMRPCSNFRYEYSIDNIEWHSSTELLAGTDTDNKTYNAAYGNASESYVAANAKTTVLRYVRYHIEIGFNIGEDAQ